MHDFFSRWILELQMSKIVIFPNQSLCCLCMEKSLIFSEVGELGQKFINVYVFRDHTVQYTINIYATIACAINVRIYVFTLKFNQFLTYVEWIHQLIYLPVQILSRGLPALSDVLGKPWVIHRSTCRDSDSSS